MERISKRIGYCIYCGLADGPLSKEHVVPYALGGTATLSDASCTECARITSRFEFDVARCYLSAYRARAELPTRRPKERPKTLPLELVYPDGSKRILSLQASEHPGTLVLPDLPEPSLIEPILKEPRRSFRFFVALPDSDAMNLPRKHNAAEMKLGEFEIGCYYLLLAKVAHAGAFLYPGEWNRLWEPLLPDLILGKEKDYERFVGGTVAREFDASDATFPVFYRTMGVNGTMYLVAFFRLFGQNDTPTYQVIVGRCRNCVTSDDLRQIHPDGLSALAVTPEEAQTMLDGLESG